MTLGVEEEFLLVDAGSGELVPRAAEIFPRARDLLGASVATELNRCQIETDTRVCSSLAEVRRELNRLRRALAEIAGQEGTALAASGTHPFSRWEDQDVDTSRRRYARMEEELQVVARETIICGCHVHVGLGDPEAEITVMQRSRPWLPVLLALSANSPFWQGDDTGYDSFRTQVWRRWPTAGMPPQLSDRPEYDRLVEEMVAAGAIADPTHIYWYVRPSARFPTLEFRVCDVCLGIDDTVAVAGITRALAWTCAEQGPEAGDGDDQRREVLNAAMWRASRFGLADSLLHPEVGEPRAAAEVVRHLLDWIRPGLEAHGDWDEVSALTERILLDGNGAARQRTAFRDGDGKAVAAYVIGETWPGSG